VFGSTWWVLAILAAAVALLGLIAKKPVFGGALEAANPSGAVGRVYLKTVAPKF
jgi:hypothetical protein